MIVAVITSMIIITMIEVKIVCIIEICLKVLLYSILGSFSTV